MINVTENFTCAQLTALYTEFMARALTDEQVLEIRQLRHEGAKTVDLAVRFGIAQPTVSDICNGRLYGHLGYPTGVQPKTAVEKASARRRGLTSKVARFYNEDGLTFQEIADKLNVSPSFVQRIYRENVLGEKRNTRKVNAK